MTVNPSTQTFILNWGHIASSWGMNRTVAQIHALLLISPNPLTADEIKNTLQVARSNVSVSLRELQNWGLIEMVNVMGDRKKRYEAHKDMKDMFKQVMRIRREREVEVALKCLNECALSSEGGGADNVSQNQIDNLTDVFTKLDRFYGNLLDEL